MQRKETYLANRAINAFRWWFAFRQRLNSHFVAKDEGYPKLQLVILDFVDILIDFHPEESMEFTATALVFKWEVAQHITAVRI